MYIVKRPFRDAEGMIPAGSIVEPAGIKRFKRRLQEKHIIEVDEHNFDKYAEYFHVKFGTEIKPYKKKAAQASEPTPTLEPVSEHKEVKKATKIVAASTNKSAK